jgi:hypothetical protein
MAAIMADGLARFFPAMANAVPWSGLMLGLARQKDLPASRDESCHEDSHLEAIQLVRR